MDYDSETSLQNGRKKRGEASDKPDKPNQRSCKSGGVSRSWHLINAAAAVSGTATQAKVPLGVTANRSLTAQVMEYYQKYSQNSNLNQYFSLPTTTTSNTVDNAKYYYSIYELNPKYIPARQSIVEEDSTVKSCIPKERRRWVRPPLIGQSSTEASSIYVKRSMTDCALVDPITEQQEPATLTLTQQQQHQQTVGISTASNSSAGSEAAAPIVEEHSNETAEGPLQESAVSEISATERKATSPTSSVASHKPLEWDSGADVGYLAGAQPSSTSTHRLSTLERMALARGCSAALRLDPEGTTEHQQQQSPGSRTGTSPQALTGKPEATSTPILQPPSVSGSESEIEITPIVKNHLPGLLVGEDAVSGPSSSTPICRKELLKNLKDSDDTPKTSASIFKRPHPLKYQSEDTSLRLKGAGDEQPASNSKESNSDNNSAEGGPLKKSTSMNLLVSSASQLPLKRSQSDLNLCGNDKPVPRLIFNSTSSIATVVNKPATCNKLIQTSMRVCAQESVGVQVSVPKNEEKPPLPKRATSLGPKSLNSILKNSKSTYRVQNPKTPCANRMMTDENIQVDIEKKVDSSSDYSQNASLTPLADDTENVTGRANSFEYFPGHIYENVPNGSTSHVSSVDTGATHSTMPNTSSSIDEKLWGDSDSLVRDLERSVHILKSLVDANKLDKHVKKRLIHHVVKRLITAKYTDDKIEHNLEENVPWNPADARNKVYRTEIIQALAKNTTDSSDDWKPTQKKKNSKKSSACNEARTMKEIINAAAEIESSTTDKFDRNTDRTVMDGRKARMGLRVDDCGRRSSTNTPTNKSESSECFVPQHIYSKKGEIKKVLTTSTSNTSTQDQNRALLDAVVNSRRSPIDSSNEVGNCADWRMPTTVSERRYEMRRCSHSDSGDTKLVSYAEMEKRNQLVWITNEISHLSNLKKLLEQPKTKSERHSKSSPRKSKQALCNLKPPKALPSTHLNHQQNSEVTGEESQWDRQWSSHCNLASTSLQNNSNTVKRLKKRNSCTQTATNNSAAYSRSGSEIVSARLCSPKTKWANACIQTPRPVATTEVIASVQQCQRCNGLPHHQTTVPATYVSSGQIHGQACCNVPDNLKQQHYLTCSNETKQSTHKQANFMCSNSEGTKEVKNQLNAITVKCACENNDKHVLEGQKELSSANQITKDHCCDGICLGALYRMSEASGSQCVRECECKNKKLVCGFSRMQINVSSKNNQFDKVNEATCVCEHSEQKERNYNHTNAVSQPHHLTNSNNTLNSQSCCCRNKKKDQNATNSNSMNRNDDTNETASSNCKSCRICGTVYQKDRNCSCVPKSYPKPVAYELSFVNSDITNDNSESSQYSKVNIEVKKLERNYDAPSTRNHPKSKSSVGTCSCGASQQTVKHYDCNHKKDKPRRIRKEKASLQEYLISNNPGFADNVETRRQYVSEIQRLRQLRKDKRVHLLAMASTTNMFKSPRPAPVAKCKPRKISDKEMRDRLRKRYSQLSEVREKRKQQQLQEEARCNKLMAKIFCKKLQQKVLRGQVDLSQSASVISNL